MDNVHGKNGCPALGMHDQRSVGTNYAPIREMNNNMMKAAGFKNSHEYRMHLQKNGADILTNETSTLAKNFTCSTVPAGEVNVAPVPSNLGEGVRVHSRCHWFENPKCADAKPVDRD